VCCWLSGARAVATAATLDISRWGWVSAHPLWAMTVIVINALVIWALIVHGREMRTV